MNPYVYNPALAGVEGHSALFMMFRQQWVGINGAPLTGYVAFHAPVKHSLGLGGIVLHDRVGPLVSTQGLFSVSYLVNLDRTHFFRFGVSVGAGYESVDLNALFGEGALAERYAIDFQGIRSNNIHLLANFGMMYHFGRFNVGVSLPYLVSRESTSPSLLTPTSFSPIDNIFFKMNYRQSFANDAIAIDPNVLFRYNRQGHHQLEGSLIIHLAHVVWIGATYRTSSVLKDLSADIIALAGFKIGKVVALGYAYDLGIGTGITRQSQGSHEVHLGFHLGSRFADASHSHSFIKSEGRKRLDTLALDSLAEKEKDTVAEKPIAPIEDTLAEETLAEDTPQDRPSGPPLVGAYARRGNHPIELPVGSYVIAGVYKEYANADNYKGVLQRAGYTASVGFNSERKFFYVDVFHSKDATLARQKRDELRTLPIFANAWVLTIIE